jgi:hypothetical protein
MLFMCVLQAKGACMTTTFIRRTEPHDGEVTIRIYHDAGAVLGAVTAPGGLAGSDTAAEADHDGSLGIHQALASAIELAGRHGNTVGVIDEEGHWRPEWGDLADETALN